MLPLPCLRQPAAATAALRSATSTHAHAARALATEPEGGSLCPFAPLRRQGAVASARLGAGSVSWGLTMGSPASWLSVSLNVRLVTGCTIGTLVVSGPLLHRLVFFRFGAGRMHGEVTVARAEDWVVGGRRLSQHSDLHCHPLLVTHATDQETRPAQSYEENAAVCARRPACWCADPFQRHKQHMGVGCFTALKGVERLCDRMRCGKHRRSLCPIHICRRMTACSAAGALDSGIFVER